MFYRLLGMVVWRAGKWFLRRKYAAARAPWPVVAGVGVLAIGVAALGLKKRG